MGEVWAVDAITSWFLALLKFVSAIFLKPEIHQV